MESIQYMPALQHNTLLLNSKRLKITLGTFKQPYYSWFGFFALWV